ncbi:ATP-binding protein [Desulfobacterales bacterium HSG16]|nr:ATP-binding protein [Desulfobacterales bacterium HSG16]
MNIITNLGKRTISRDLLAGLAFAICIVATMIGTFFFIVATQNLQRELEEKTASISDEIVRVITLPMWNVDFESIQQTFQAYLNSEYLVGVRVKAEKRILFDKIPANVKKLILLKRTIYKKKHKIGEIELYFTDQNVKRTQKTMIYSMIISIGSVIIALILGTHFIMSTLLDKPLQQLICGIRTIARGDYSHPLDSAPQNDIDSIIREVNLMAGDIDKREVEAGCLNAELAEHRDHLENIVDERTAKLTRANMALEESMENLKKTQDDLVESRKMAALGGLVAGIAHEVNTPVGIGVTAASFLERKTTETNRLFNSGSLKRSDLEKYLNTATDSSASILLNLSRAAELIQSFKKLAVDQTSEEKRHFKLSEYLNNMLLSLRPKYKRTQHTITVDCHDDIVLYSYPGAFMQIITNLVVNSLYHGFENVEKGKMSIHVKDLGTKICITYKDDGEGMNQEQCNKIFDPFYTTRRTKGGTGLGMHIVYNLVTRTLGGKIDCESEPGNGAVFTIQIPREEEMTDEGQ